MGLYDRYILPPLINLACSSKPNMKQREKVVPLAEGEVFPFYDTDKVRKVWGLEPSEGMRLLARKKLAGSELNVELIDLPGEEIPLDTNSVDTVVVTYTLCTIPDAQRALRGMRRVLRPGGHLLFCEHGAAPDEGVRRWQERLNPIWRRFSGGCNINKDIPGLLESSGFRVVVDERMYIPGVKALSYNYWGSAAADRLS
ncbi:MAG: methyltransferase domain-containing protein [Deltaproteobacteria bacterium]|nr:methyltransferase domain-containing protein [Deltaproteobacteria bacterium]